MGHVVGDVRGDSILMVLQIVFLVVNIRRTADLSVMQMVNGFRFMVIHMPAAGEVPAKRASASKHLTFM